MCVGGGVISVLLVCFCMNLERYKDLKVIAYTINGHELMDIQMLPFSFENSPSYPLNSCAVVYLSIWSCHFLFIAVLRTEAAQCGRGTESPLPSHPCPVSGDSAERGGGTQGEDPDTVMDCHIPLQGELTEGNNAHMYTIRVPKHAYIRTMCTYTLHSHRTIIPRLVVYSTACIECIRILNIESSACASAGNHVCFL